MKAELGNIVKIEGELIRIIGEDVSGYFLGETYHKDASGEGMIEFEPSKIEEIVGSKCDRCKGDILFAQGCYRYAGGETWCTPCGDREKIKV